MHSNYILDNLSDKCTPAQQIALVRIMEEAGEVVQQAAKTLRFGLVAIDKSAGNKKYDNVSLLITEANDLENALHDFKSLV